MPERRRRDLRARLTALAGLVVIVGGAALVLFLVGVEGAQRWRDGERREDRGRAAPGAAAGAWAR